MRFSLAIALTFSLSFFAAKAQDQAEFDFVIEFFNKLQPISIAENTEYCGYFALDDNDNYIATKPTKGEEDSCFADEPPKDMEIFASYHTHSAFSYDADSELPSSYDLEADISEEIDGYIATPGGRVWYLDAIKEKAFLLCGRSCTVSDDRYDANANLPVLNKYDLELLLKREEIMD